MSTDLTLPSELKFVVSGNVGAGIRAWARNELDPDPHAVEGDGYRTTSLYFDTDEFDTFFGRLSYARAKYRIRRYNDSSFVFLERKLKADGRVAKRRSKVALVELHRAAATGTWEGQWFWRRLQHRRLRPVCQVAYSRTARVGIAPAGPMRLTIDEEIAAAAIDTIAFGYDSSVEVLPGLAILELKYRVHVPLLFKRLIEEFRLQPRPASKYRLAVQAVGLADEEKRMSLHA